MLAIFLFVFRIRQNVHSKEYDNDDESIKTFMTVNYNRTVLEINQLEGYKDLNFKLDLVDEKSDKTFGYENVILKTLSAESAEFIDLQHRMMNYLHGKGVDTCKPVKSIEGWTVCKIKVLVNQDEETVTDACVLTYIPGITIRCANHPIGLFEDVGRLSGRVDNLLLKFEQDCLHDTDTLWELSRAPEVETYLNKYCSKDVRDLGLDIINAFNRDISPVLDSFQKGYIHGDINDCNIIVSRTPSDTEAYTISGLIDFGDACASFYIYEIATLMADLMSTCRSKRDPLEVGRLVLKGYRQEFQLNAAELKCLRLVICVRMIQYYALGTDVVFNDPSNEYAKLDIDDYLNVCQFLWNVSDEQFKRDVID